MFHFFGQMLPTNWVERTTGCNEGSRDQRGRINSIEPNLGCRELILGSVSKFGGMLVSRSLLVGVAADKRPGRFD
jgi:hypothetical protein